MTSKDARGNLQYANYGITWNPFYYCADGTGTNWQQNETKATGGPTAAHNNPPPESRTHLSTTSFHMQVAARCSHWSPTFPIRSARAAAAVRSPAANKARGSARRATRQRSVPSHTRTRGVNIAPPTLPAGQPSRGLLLAKGSHQRPRKGAWQPRRACTHATVNTNRCGVGLHAADTGNSKPAEGAFLSIPTRFPELRVNEVKEG